MARPKFSNWNTGRRMGPASREAAKKNDAISRCELAHILGDDNLAESIETTKKL